MDRWKEHVLRSLPDDILRTAGKPDSLQPETVLFRPDSGAAIQNIRAKGVDFST